MRTFSELPQQASSPGWGGTASQRPSRGFRFATLLLALSWGCSGGDESGITDPSGRGSASVIQPSAVLAVSGNGQVGEVGTTVGTPLVVQVKNAAGAVVQGISVTWNVTEGEGALSTSTSVTDAQGKTTQPGWTLGTRAGNQKVAASVSGLKAVTFVAEATPSSPVSISLDPDQISLPAGGSIALHALAKDSYENPITSGFSWSSSNASVATVDSRGIVTGVYPGTATITANIGGVSSSSAVEVTASPPAEIKLTGGQTQEAVVGEELSAPLEIEVLDIFGEGVPGVEVVWEVTQGGGTLSVPDPSASSGHGGPMRAPPAKKVTTTTDSGGKSKASWKLGDESGTQTTTATVEEETAVFNAIGKPGTPATVSIESTPLSLPIGGSSETLVAQVRDNKGNLVENVAVTWQSSNPGVATVSGSGIVTPVAVGSATITAYAEGPTATATVFVLASQPTDLRAVAGDGQTAQVGRTLTQALVVEVVDGVGDPVPGTTVRWSVAGGGGSLSASSGVTDASGRAQTTWTLGTTSGVNQASAAVPNLTQVLFSAEGTAGPATNLNVLPENASVGIGETAELQAFPTDAYGNVRTDPVSWTSSAPGVVRVDVVDGSTARATGVSAGSASVRASLGGVSGAASVTVPEAVPALAYVGGTGQTGTVGQTLPVPLQVRVTNADNGDPMQGVAVQWTVAQGGGTVSGTSTVTDATGHTQVNWTLGTTPGGKEVTAAIQGGQSVSFSANATVGPVASVTISPASGSVTVGATGTYTATAKDQYGNRVSAPVSWSSSNQSVATVGVTTGIVTGIKRGTSILTAVVSGMTGTVTLTVDPAPPPLQVSSLEVVSTTLSSATVQFSGISDGAGAPSYYELRYDEGFAGWDTAIPVATGPCAGVFQGGGIGDQITCVVDGLKSGTTYFFYVRSRRTDPDGTVVVGVVASASGTTVSVDPTVPASVVVVDGDLQTAEVGWVLPTLLTVEVRNALGEPLSGVTVTWAVTAGGGALDSTNTVTLANGQTGVEWSLGTEPGEGGVTATVSGIPPVKFRSTTTAGPVATVIVTPDPQTVEVGSSTLFAAVAKDSHGNPVTSTFTWTSLNPGIAAIASPSGTVIGVSAGSATVYASVGGVSGSTSVTVEPEKFPSVKIQSGNNQEGQVGEILPLPLLVLVRDASENPAVGFPVTWSVIQGGGTVSSTVTNTDGQGYAQVTWTLGSASGTQSVSATVDGIGSATFSANGLGGGTPGGGAEIYDGFESGNLLYTTPDGFAWGLEGDKVFVTSDQAYSGSNSLAFRYPATADGVDSSAELRFRLTSSGYTAPSEVWIEYMVRVPENYKHRAQSSTTNNKIIALWAEDYNGWATEAIYVVEAGRVGDFSSYIRYAAANGEGETRHPDEYLSPQGLIFSSADIGNWIRLRYHLKIGNRSGDYGILDVWKNNTLIASLPSNWIAAEGTGKDYWRRGYLFGWSNSGFDQETIFYVDDFSVSTTDPGW